MVAVRLDLAVEKLGICRAPSPMTGVDFVDDQQRVLYHSILSDAQESLSETGELPSFELAGPRNKVFYDPSKLKCGIVTCGGLCPGVNDVIRSIVLALHHHYHVPTVFGFRYGFEGLTYKHGHTPMELTPSLVADIHKVGGTLLGSSRGPQDVDEMVDTLERMNIGLLFAIGGDGTLRGAQAIHEEIKKRNLKIGVIGIPKTIDNDISFIDTSFGFETAVSSARTSIYSAHTEALGARNGIGLVKLMGRESGFIAAYATLSNGDVNFCLIPEVAFSLESLLHSLEARLENRRHAVIVVGEGAGQDLIKGLKDTDASGNVKLHDIGIFLKEKINEYFKSIGMDITLKYIDPSYTIRSLAANPKDSSFCLLLGQNAVHAGMTGRTNMVLGHWNRHFTHVPISLAISKRKQIDPKGRLWNNVLSATGQPACMV
jgi:6-phosphofructokinase 1